MRRTFQPSVSSAELYATTQGYAERGWTVAETANGVSLVSDRTVCGVEVVGELATRVRNYLESNALIGPVIDVPGDEPREIYLVTGIDRAALAVAALREMGAVVHCDGAGIPLPPTQLHAGSASWIVAPDDARWIPPVVALSAAVRAVRGGSAAAAARAAS
ncbi:hypothetical protein [Skermania piniformis]|uniref:hypothetical protein n=1 Tax=Skermania pinensis TaxID=39122 RepID=UPI00082F44CA|nr:hypothetical protein [Skermania piniformis]